MNVRLYVTRWVLARGILLMTGRLGRRSGSRSLKDWYSLDTGKWDRYRRHWVCIGKDAFWTLEEAQAAARQAFVEAARDADARARALSASVRRIATIQVHDLTEGTTNISDLHAFNDHD